MDGAGRRWGCDSGCILSHSLRPSALLGQFIACTCYSYCGSRVFHQSQPRYKWHQKPCKNYSCQPNPMQYTGRRPVKPLHFWPTRWPDTDVLSASPLPSSLRGWPRAHLNLARPPSPQVIPPLTRALACPVCFPQFHLPLILSSSRSYGFRIEASVRLPLGVCHRKVRSGL